MGAKVVAPTATGSTGGEEEEEEEEKDREYELEAEADLDSSASALAMSLFMSPREMRCTVQAPRLMNVRSERPSRPRNR